MYLHIYKFLLFSGNISVITLAEASKIAKAKNLNLLRHKDPHLQAKGRRDVYKLFENKDLFKKSDKTETKGSYIKVSKEIFSFYVC